MKRVMLRGDLAGDYIVVEEHADGSLVVEPDQPIESVRSGHNLGPATLEEFEAEYGLVQPPDGRTEPRLRRCPLGLVEQLVQPLGDVVVDVAS